MINMVERINPQAVHRSRMLRRSDAFINTYRLLADEYDCVSAHLMGVKASMAAP